MSHDGGALVDAAMVKIEHAMQLCREVAADRDAIRAKTFQQGMLQAYKDIVDFCEASPLGADTAVDEFIVALAKHIEEKVRLCVVS